VEVDGRRRDEPTYFDLFDFEWNRIVLLGAAVYAVISQNLIVVVGVLFFNLYLVVAGCEIDFLHHSRVESSAKLIFDLCLSRFCSSHRSWPETLSPYG